MYLINNENLKDSITLSFFIFNLNRIHIQFEPVTSNHCIYHLYHGHGAHRYSWSYNSANVNLLLNQNIHQVQYGCRN